MDANARLKKKKALVAIGFLCGLRSSPFCMNNGLIQITQIDVLCLFARVCFFSYFARFVSHTSLYVDF